MEPESSLPYSQVLNCDIWIYNSGHLPTDTVYLREQGCENPCYFQKPKGVHEQKRFGDAELGLLNDAVSSSDDIASCNILL